MHHLLEVNKFHYITMYIYFGLKVANSYLKR